MNSIMPVAVAITLFAGGLLGVFLPFLPGVPLAWLGLFIYAYTTSFRTISVTALIIFLGLTLCTGVFDMIAPFLGAKKHHASRYGMWGAFAGMLFGILVAGPFGFILGPFAGAFVGETASGKPPALALRAAIGVFLGVLVSSIVRFAVIISMIVFFIFSVFHA